MVMFQGSNDSVSPVRMLTTVGVIGGLRHKFNTVELLRDTIVIQY